MSTGKNVLLSISHLLLLTRCCLHLENYASSIFLHFFHLSFATSLRWQVKHRLVGLLVRRRVNWLCCNNIVLVSATF